MKSVTELLPRKPKTAWWRMKSVTELLPRKPKTASETFAAQNLVPLHHHAACMVERGWESGWRRTNCIAQHAPPTENCLLAHDREERVLAERRVTDHAEDAKHRGAA